MPITQVVIDGTAIVALGTFPISKFQASAFADSDGKPFADFQDASIVLLLPNEVVQLDLRFANVLMEAQRLLVSTKVEAPIPEKVREIAMALIGQLGSEITAVGINRDLHFSAPDKESYDLIGFTSFNHPWWTERLSDPQMLSLTVRANRNGGLPGHVNIKIEPSIKVAPLGVYVQVNDHFDFPLARGPREFADFLTAEWQSITDRSNRIIEEIRGIVK